MRPGQSNKRSRGRGRKGPSPLSRSYESNGPDVKIRGTAQHIADKYINLARDAQSSGDTVLTEAYMQHAEHFYRIVAAAQQQMNQPVNVKRADDPIETEESESRSDYDPSDPDAPQPDANAEGNQDGNRGGQGRDEDGDGDRRNRRNRGRQRRGRDDRDQFAQGQDRDSRDGREGRGDNREQQPNGHANGADEGAAPLEADAQPNGQSEDQPSDGEQPRRAPRQRRTRVDVEDRFAASNGGNGQASDNGSAESAPAEAADASAPVEPPRPVTLGDDVAPVQAAGDESS